MWVTANHVRLPTPPRSSVLGQFVKVMRRQQAQFEKLQEAALDADTISWWEKLKLADCFIFNPHRQDIGDWAVGEEGEEEEEEDSRGGTVVASSSSSRMSAENGGGSSYAAFAMQIFELSTILKKRKRGARRYFSGSHLRVKSSKKKRSKRIGE